ncbi:MULTISPECIES: tetratricopeptide repeat protein [unclassified Lentimicrobium]|uniref:tetratricopeptide repeat-containing sensor histidine kinase n=1 Tax=unclassified Lentimicrobium TaxID=2677434 RepID=UPI001557025E|nr:MULTISPECIES: tetratricopeptide repeat protein [unclassified Lentimicrobium]NPD45401.1 tetratricopeptide repeat protein [Lentimicrobium sp. S6]NPD84900.1 tetratricopeptide repeat protein [Lentimicrobium sp. L6]
MVILKKAIPILALIFIMTGNLGFSQTKVDSIISEIDTTKNLYRKTTKQLHIAESYMRDRPHDAIEYAESALNNSLLLKDTMLILNAYKSLIISFSGTNGCDQVKDYYPFGFTYARTAKDSASYYADMGVVFTICGNLREAEVNYHKAMLLYKQMDDKINVAVLMTNMGVTYARNGQYYQASSNYLKALQISEEMKDEESIATTYQNMGEVMALQKQYDKAVGYYNSALNIYQKHKNQADMAAVYLNLGQIYIEQEEWDVAKHYLNRSYVIDTAQNLLHLESLALKQLGITYLKADEFISAQRLVSAALYIQYLHNYSSLIPETATLLAEIYYKQGKYTEALNILNNSEYTTKEIGDTNLLSRIYLLKSSILDILNQHDKAYKYLKNSVKISDSIFNIESSKSIMNLELAYQTEKKEKQIDELKFNDSLRQEQLKSKSIQLYLLIVIAILILIIMIYVLLYIRRRHFKETEQREKQFLQDRFEAEERAKDKIARDLHDDIGGQMIGMILQFQSANKLDEKEIGQLQNIYMDVRRLSHSLNEPIFSEITLQEKIRNYLSELKAHAPFQTQFIDDFSPKWDTILGYQDLQRNLYRIIQEQLTNTLKHAQATEVDIQLLNEDQHLIMIYEDNGIGLDSVESKDGQLKFNTIRKRVKLFTGEFEFNSQKGHGVFMMIRIPLQFKK